MQIAKTFPDLGSAHVHLDSPDLVATMILVLIEMSVKTGPTTVKNYVTAIILSEALVASARPVT